MRCGQQRTARADDRGHERLEQRLGRDCAVGLRGYESTVDRGEGEILARPIDAPVPTGVNAR
jgi:hypothetical protein